MALTFNQRLVSSKIDILAEQRNHLQTLVQDVDEVLQQANSWLRNTDETNNVKFKDISKMIEDKVVFLSEKFTNDSDGCIEIAGQQESDTTRHMSAVSTSITQAFSTRNNQDLVVPDELKTIMSQVKVMQDAMSFLSINTEKISEKQSIMEQSIENLSIKYFKEGQEKLKEIERELKNISEKQKETKAQQDKSMKSLENRIQAVTDAQSEINENQQLQKSMMKEQKKENGQYLKQSEQFIQDLNVVLENVQELNGRICLLENQGLINTELEALDNKLTFLKANSESLTEKFEEHVSLSEEFTRETKETLIKLLSVQGKEFEKLQKFEEKISVLEMSWNESSDEAKKSFKDVENKYQMICHVIADRLAPLERLRAIFNEKLDVRKENMKKLNNLCFKMACLLPKFSQLERENQRQAIGFSACGSFATKTTFDYTGFTHTFNIGNHFNPTTGVFTAPMEGLYGSFLSVRSIEHGSFGIIKEPCQFRHTSFTCCDDCNMGKVLINKGDRKASVFGVVYMKPRNTLLVRCFRGNDEGQYNITFACFRIG